MNHTMPTSDRIIRNDFTTGKIHGGQGDDHLIHHRNLSVGSHASVGLVGFGGNDILEASVPNRGQVHMFAADGDDWMIMDVTKISGAQGHQGHHAYGGHGRDTFQFVNVDRNLSPIVGRLDDFDPTADRIMIENMIIDLFDLPSRIQLANGAFVNIRVVEIEHPEFRAENLGKQHFLVIGDQIFYALEGARDLINGTSGRTGEERHFLSKNAFPELLSAPSVQYENPVNFVPLEFILGRESELNLNWSPAGAVITADIGDKQGAHIFGSKSNHSHTASSGAQEMFGSNGHDVIDGNTGNDTIFGGLGDDLIAGGIDNDLLFGGLGDDTIWGGDGDDTIYSNAGNDYVEGNRGADLIIAGPGDSILKGGDGDDRIFAFSGINTLHGDDGNDLLVGGIQGDTLFGGNGNDVLIGDTVRFVGGSDRLVGGPGNDFLMGGAGADTFVFSPNHGNDTIGAIDRNAGDLDQWNWRDIGVDFEPGVDKILLTGFERVNTANVLSYLRGGDDGAIFSAEQTSITFHGITLSALSVDDFVIA